MKEKIETVDEYVELIKNARDPPFIMIDVSSKQLKDFEKYADLNKDLKKIKISKEVKVNYFPNGHIDVFYAYEDKPITYRIENNLLIDSLENGPPAGGVGISKEKLQDLKKLINYLSPKAQNFYKNLIEKSSIKKSKIKKEPKTIKEYIIKKESRLKESKAKPRSSTKRECTTKIKSKSKK